MRVCFPFVKSGPDVGAMRSKYRVAKYENLGQIYLPALIAFDRVNALVCIEERGVTRP